MSKVIQLTNTKEHRRIPSLPPTPSIYRYNRIMVDFQEKYIIRKRKITYLIFKNSGQPIIGTHCFRKMSAVLHVAQTDNTGI